MHPQVIGRDHRSPPLKDFVDQVIDLVLQFNTRADVAAAVAAGADFSTPLQKQK